MEDSLFIFHSKQKLRMTLIKKIKEKGIPGFLAKIILFIVILFLLDFSIGSVLRYFYFKQHSGLLYRTTYSLDSTRAQMLIFGSSTANHHYYPDAFEKRMHLSVYNTGRDGNSIFYPYSILLSTLKRYSPKIVILDFDVKNFLKDQESYDRISSLLPYYDKHPEIRPIIQLKSPNEKYKLLSKIYPFNSLLFTIAIGNSEFNRSRENNNDDKGYVPLTEIWNRKILKDTSNSKYKLDKNKINIFRHFIKDCDNYKVKLYIVISPRFVIRTFKDSSIVTAQKIANQVNIPFYDFSNDTTFLNHANFFADQGHLNDRGARIFSNKVIDSIFKDQQEKKNN